MIGEKLKLGEILVKEKFLTEEDLEHLLLKQNELPEKPPLGELAIAEGFITRQELKNILKMYKKQMRMGELLTSSKIISEKQLEEALAKQKELGKKLGEVLIELGYITEDELMLALSQQFDIPRMKPDSNVIDFDLVRLFNRKFLEANAFIPVFSDKESTTIIMANPFDEKTISGIQARIKNKLVIGIASKNEILSAINLVYENYHLKKLDGQKGKTYNAYGRLVIGNVDLGKGDDKTVSIVNYIILNAFKEGASDIHIEPQLNRLRVRYRIDGVLFHKTDLPISMALSIASRIKAVCGLDIAEKRRHQDGKITASIMGKEVDLRVSTYASTFGETVVIRILARHTSLIDLENLGFSPLNLFRYRTILDYPSGVILVTGPTGSGKSTTLYASLAYLNNKNLSIITVEDPVEYMIDGVVQGKLDPKLGMTYMDFIKSMMRQDPDVLMVGEIRDNEGAEATIQAALTGHKVLTSFHTDDTTGALLRLLDMGIDTFLVSSTVVSVVSQRLVRTICPNCKVEDKAISKGLLRSFKISPQEARNFKFYKGEGCEKCNNTGYKGRSAIHELLLVNDAIRDAILKKKTSTEIRNIARHEADLLSIREDGVYKALCGLTTLEEINRVVFHAEVDQYIPRKLHEIFEVSKRQYEDIDENKSIYEIDDESDVIEVSADEVKKEELPARDESIDEKENIEKISPENMLYSFDRESRNGIEVFRIRLNCRQIEDEIDAMKDIYMYYVYYRKYYNFREDDIDLSLFIEAVIFYAIKLRVNHSVDFAEAVIRNNGKELFIYLESVTEAQDNGNGKDNSSNLVYEIVDFDFFKNLLIRPTPLQAAARA
ncbi:MAG: GspE/PulE family protein [Candidatus Schekmanbacteria bacterium]|nr:MAG: GspE/PulE family protein [Candidatus Schekmanbacteria bacterium]